MKHFVLGFAFASALWLAVLSVVEGWLPLSFTGASTDTQDAGVLAERSSADPGDADRRKPRGKKRQRQDRRRNVRSLGPEPPEQYDTSDGFTGDDLGSPGARALSMERGGGEDQLTNAEIEHGIDGVFAGVQRCLVLVPPGAPAAGKVVFGLHIANTGRVTKVNLKGPNTIIQGECGSCLRRTVQSIRYRGFDGPDMIVHYPVVFE